MIDARIDSVKVNIAEKPYIVVGKEFYTMLDVVKSCPQPKDYINKVWVFSADADAKAIRTYLKRFGLDVATSKASISPEMMAQINALPPKPKNGNGKAELSPLAKPEITIDDVMRLYSPDSGINGNEMMPGYNVTYNQLAQYTVNTYVYFWDRVKDQNKNHAPMTKLETFTHVLDSVSMNVDTTRWHIWRDKTGLKRQINYKVAESWIRQECGKGCLIHPVILEGEEKSQYTNNELDIAVACYLVQESDRRDVLSQINPDSNELRKENNDLNVTDSRRMAKNMLARDWAIAEAIGVVTFDELYKTTEKDGISFANLDNNKNPIIKYGAIPNGRDITWKAKKRAISSLAYELGDIFLKGKTVFTASPEKPKLLTDNPGLDKADPERQAQFLTKSESPSKNMSSEDRINLTRDPEDFEGHN